MLCITKQPKPEMPHDAGTLDAQTSAFFRVEFLGDGTLGNISLVKSTHMQRLDDLATAAVRKITFLPKQIQGRPVTAYRILHYRYSWEFGWKAEPGPCRK
jgi:TonB family protein